MLSICLLLSFTSLLFLHHKCSFKTKKIPGDSEKGGEQGLERLRWDVKAAWSLLAGVLLLLVLILIFVILQEREQQAWAVSPCAVSLKSKVIF